MPVPQPPVTNYPTNRAAPDDDRSLWAKLGRARVEALLARGWPQPGRFLKSLRVGVGSTTAAALDGSDGLISADGTGGGLLFVDRTTSTNYGIWYETGSVIVLGYQGGNVWLVAPATGVITQAARTTLTAGTNISLGVAGWATQGSRIVVPTGYAEVQLTLKATAAISAGAVVAVVAAGHRPAGIVGGTLNRLPLGVAANAVSVPFFVDTAGNVSLGNTTLANTDTLIGLISYATV